MKFFIFFIIYILFLYLCVRLANHGPIFGLDYFKTRKIWRITHKNCSKEINSFQEFLDALKIPSIKSDIKRIAHCWGCRTPLSSADCDICPLCARYICKECTEYGYYTENGEQFLDQNIESPITGVNAKIREFATSARPEISLDEKELKSILLYIKSSLARSNLACKEFNDHSITAQLFPDAVNHDQLVEFSIKTQGPIDDILKSLSVGILINETSKTFVIPRNCIYVVHSNDRPAIIAPIAPKVAYILIPNDCKDSKEILVVEKESDIIAMNHQALMYEYIFNYDFVAANNREDIDELKIFLGKNRAILENIKNSIQSIQ